MNYRKYYKPKFKENLLIFLDFFLKKIFFKVFESVHEYIYTTFNKTLT
jgi:hypothetical protein